MIGAEIIFNTAGKAIEKEMDKLTPRTRGIIVNSLTAAFGLAVGILAVKRLVKLLNDNEQVS